VKAAALGEAMAQADFVFVAVPLSAGALHLIGHRCLESGKPGQLLINVGRGSVVDEEAVADALEDGQLGGYASDVYAMEDWGLSQRPRQIPVRLLSHPATVFTPHLGSAVREVRIAIEHRAADNIIAALQGKAPPDAINQPVRVAA
jgi:phosphonate dehydrogenase